MTDIRKGRAYEIFAAARERNLSITEASDEARVSRPTGTRWERARVAKDIAIGQRTGPVSKGELVGLYSEALRSAPPQVVSQIGAAYQKIMGFETTRETEALAWPSATIAYIDEEHRRLSARTHACSEIPIVPPRSPNAESNDITPLVSQSFEKNGGASKADLVYNDGKED